MQNNLTKPEIKNKIDNLEKYFSKYKNGTYTEKINEIKDILDKKDYKIAVVANMSSGKSTFINALFGKEVLPANSEAVTDSATYIFSKPNIEKKAEIFFSDGRENIIITENLERELGLYSYKDEKIERDEKERKEDLSQYKNVEKVDLYYPFLNLQTSSSEDFRVTFIDTPGPNSTGVSGDKHKNQTSDVIREIADMVLFVFDYVQLDTNLEVDEKNLWGRIKNKLYGNEAEDTKANKNFEVYFLINKIDMAMENDNFKDISSGISNEEFIKQKKENWFKHEKIAIDKIVNAAKKHGIDNPKVYPISSYYQLLERNNKKNLDAEDTLDIFKKKHFKRVFENNWEEEFIKYLGIAKIEDDINQYIKIGLKEKILKTALNNLIDITKDEDIRLQTDIQTLSKPKDEATANVERALKFLDEDAKELEKNMNNDFKLSSEKAIKEITDLIDRAIENELYSKIDEMARIAIAYAEAIADGNIPSNAKTISIRNYSKINVNEEVILELENSINVEQVLSEMQNYMKSIFEDYRNNYLDVKIDLKNSFVDYEREISKIFKKVKDRLNSELQEALDIDIQNIDMQTVDIDSTLSFDISIPDSVLDYNHEEYSQTVTKTRTVERSIFNPFRWFGDKYTTEEYEDEEHISRHTLTINPIDLKESIENSMKEITENFSEKEKENYKNAIIELRRKNSDIFQDFRHNKQKEIDELQVKIENSEKELVVVEKQLEDFNNLTKE